MQKPDKPMYPEPLYPFRTTLTLNNDLNAFKFIIIMVGISLFLFTVTYISQLNDEFIPNKMMFMNIITDNYEKSVYDFNDYVNKVIDDNYKIQHLLGNTKVSVNNIPEAKSTSTSTSTKPTTAATIPSTTDSNTSSSSNGIFSVFNTDSTSTSTSNNVNSIFSTPIAEGFTNNTIVIDRIQKIKEWIMVYIKKFLSNFYIRRNTIYIRR